ncbi:hypothetical protein MCAMS1_02822 [biofilm metagenome]
MNQINDPVLTYETAQGVLIAMVSLRSEWIHKERAKPSPNYAQIAAWEAEIERFEDEREAMPVEQEAADAVIKKYSAHIKQFTTGIEQFSKVV